jgi:isoleucyl-tRNA synthetase
MSIIDRSISVHLQNFPDFYFVNSDDELVKDMDLIRDICSCALAIRDNKNLRVRLPLQSLTIIGKQANKLLNFKEIIADEVNVKEVLISDDIEQYSEMKLQVNFKKIGAKYGVKMKEISEAIQKNKWRKINDKLIEIADVELIDDEFEIKLTTKNYDENKFAVMSLPSNDYLIMLDIEISKDLEDEGITRDIVRAIQQNRKEANLDISQKISLEIFSTSSRIIQVVTDFGDYIKDQVLSSDIKILIQEPQLSTKHFYKNQLDDGDITIIF